MLNSQYSLLHVEKNLLVLKQILNEFSYNRDLNKLCENSFLFRIQLTEFSPCLACKFYFFTADVY